MNPLVTTRSDLPVEVNSAVAEAGGTHTAFLLSFQIVAIETVAKASAPSPHREGILKTIEEQGKWDGPLTLTFDQLVWLKGSVQDIAEKVTPDNNNAKLIMSLWVIFGFPPSGPQQDSSGENTLRGILPPIEQAE